MASIQPVWHLARLSFSGRPGRSLLVAFAVCVASALIVAMSCAIETAVDNVRSRMERLIGESDARIVHRHGANFLPTLIEEVRAWTGVEAVGGRLSGALSLERADGAPGSDGRPRRATVRCRGSDLGSDAAFAQVTYTSGSPPSGEREIGLDPAAAKALDAAPGTRLRVVRFGAPMELVVSGLYERPMLGALQRPSGHLSRHTLAEAADAEDGVTLISIALKEGVDPAKWVTENAGRVSSPLALEPSEVATTGLDRPARAGEFLQALATMLAFLCCALLVATAMTTALAQQQRELAIARCVGASRGQLFASQVLGGGVLCLGAGMVGVPLGLGLARGVAWWYASQLPGGMSVSTLGISLALIGATAAGVLGSLWPAWKGARIDVLAALSPHAAIPRPRPLVIAAAIAVTCIAVQLVLLNIADPERRFWGYLALGLPLIHVGWFLAAIPILAVLGRLFGGAIERVLGLPATLLTTSLASVRFRLGMVAGALMIGVAMLVGTWTSGRAILDDVTHRVRFGDAFAFKSTGFSTAEVERIRAIDGVRHFAAMGYLPVEVISEQVFGLKALSPTRVVCIGFDSEPFFAMNRLEWVAGDPAVAARRLREGNAILVASEFMTARGIAPGSILELGSGAHHLPFEVVGVVGAAGLDVATQFFGIRSLYMEHAVSCVFMEFDAVTKHFGSKEAFLIQIGLPDDATDADESRIDKAIEKAAPGSVFASGRSIRAEVLEVGRVIMTICTTIAAGALTLASLACASVIGAGVAARTREFGILQAVGASRSVLARLLMGEALLVGLTAAIVGNCFGFHIAWMESRIYHDLAGLDLAPRPHLVVGLVGGAVVVVTAILASIPAMRLVTRASPRALLGTAAA